MGKKIPDIAEEFLVVPGKNGEYYYSLSQSKIYTSIPSWAPRKYLTGQEMEGYSGWDVQQVAVGVYASNKGDLYFVKGTESVEKTNYRWDPSMGPMGELDVSPSIDTYLTDDPASLIPGGVIPAQAEENLNQLQNSIAATLKITPDQAKIVMLAGACFFLFKVLK